MSETAADVIITGEIQRSDDLTATRKVETSKFKAMLDQMNKEEHFQLEEHSGKLYVNCLPCGGKKKKLVEAGPREKSLSNLKAHVKTSKHQANVKALSEAKKQIVNQETTKERKEDKEKVLAQINKLHKGMFEELANSKEEMVRCTFCNHLIKIFSERGSFMTTSKSMQDATKAESQRKGRPQWIATLSQERFKRRIDNHRISMELAAMVCTRNA